MTNTAAAPKPATVRVVREGMELSRFSVATGALLGLMTYDEITGRYAVTRPGWSTVVRTYDRNRALHALALCS